MIHRYRLMPFISIFILLSAGLTGCVSTEELYARYDSRVCPVVQAEVPPGMPWHNAVFFPYNQSEVTAEEALKLRENLALLNKNPDYRVILRGFADSVASQRFNLPLSERRALFVSGWLISNGISRERIDQVGLGKELLLIPPAEGQDEQTNRRVEMLLVDAHGRPVSLEQPYSDSAETTSVAKEQADEEDAT